MEVKCTSSLYISYIHATLKALNFNCPSSGLLCIRYPTLVILAPADIVHVAHTLARPSVGTVQLTHLDVCSCDFSSLHDFWFHLVDLMISSLQWRHNGRDCVSNHQPRDCLLNRLFRRRSKKTSKPRDTGLCAGNPPGPVIYPHKWPVTRKMFPFDDVIMSILWKRSHEITRYMAFQSRLRLLCCPNIYHHTRVAFIFFYLGYTFIICAWSIIMPE